RAALVRRQGSVPFLKCEERAQRLGRRNAGRIASLRIRGEVLQFPQQVRIPYDQFRLHVGDDARSEVRAAAGIQRGGENAAESQAVESGNPSGAVVGPEPRAVARSDPLLLEPRGEAAGEAGDVGVGGLAASHTLKTDDCNVAVIPAKVVEQSRE